MVEHFFADLTRRSLTFQLSAVSWEDFAHDLPRLPSFLTQRFLLLSRRCSVWVHGAMAMVLAQIRM